VYSWVISATSGGSANRTFTMSVSSTAPVWTTSSIGGYYTNTFFNATLGVTSDSAVTVAIISSPGFGAVSGFQIYGTTPSYAGTFYWTLRATDAEGQISDRSVSITVYAPPIAPGWSSGGYPRDGSGAYFAGSFPQGSYFYKYVGCDIGTTPITYSASGITIFTFDSNSPAVYGYVNLNPGSYYGFYIYASNSSGTSTLLVTFYVY
jgi:hypothetical protein